MFGNKVVSGLNDQNGGLVGDYDLSSNEFDKTVKSSKARFLKSVPKDARAEPVDCLTDKIDAIIIESPNAQKWALFFASIMGCLSLKKSWQKNDLLELSHRREG